MNSDKSSNKLSAFAIFKAVMLTLILACACICAICTLFFFDQNPGYFQNVPLTYILYVAIFVAVSASVVSIIIFKEYRVCDIQSSNKAWGVPIIPACAFAFQAVMLTSDLFFGSNTAIDIVCLISSVLSCIYYFLLSQGYAQKSVVRLLGLSPVISSVAVTVSYYFENTTVMNGPKKRFIEFGFLLFAIYAINELRCICSKGYRMFYFTAVSASAVLLLCCSSNSICIMIRSSISVKDLSVAVTSMLLSIYLMISICLSRIEKCITGQCKDITCAEQNNSENDTAV